MYLVRNVKISNYNLYQKTKFMKEVFKCYAFETVKLFILLHFVKFVKWNILIFWAAMCLHIYTYIIYLNHSIWITVYK